MKEKLKILDESKLVSVNKPTRYTGHEVNQIVKEPTSVEVRMAFAFPDVYDIGMSHLGSKILYHVVNQLDWAAMERVYAPWPDYEALLRREGAVLTSLENRTPLCDFPIVGFTLQYELTYSNILTILDLGNIPLLASERTDFDPIIFAGGPGAFNPEPIADFLDLVVLGDGEEVLPILLDLYRQLAGESKGRASRKTFLERAAEIQGVYVPALYQASYLEDGTFMGVTPLNSKAAFPIRRAIVKDLDQVSYPETFILPYGDVIHDRAMIELFRGCTAGCRFCQAGCIYRPVRERSLTTLIKQAEMLIRSTGYDEISLISLSSMDYSQIESLIEHLLQKYGCQGIGVALPSLRVDSFSVEIAEKVQQVRKSGLTLAPEAGSQRLRDIINKRVTEQQIMEAVSGAFDAGWSGLKLYFMLGLPGETDEDLVEIIGLSERIAQVYRQKKRHGKLRISISVSTFVPKPHTPFQWLGQIPPEEIYRRQRLLRNLVRDRAIDISTHDVNTSYLEAIFSRGDRRLSAVVKRAYELGARFDGWTEHFRFNLWKQALEECHIDDVKYANGEKSHTSVLPWDHLDSGVRKNWLINQWNLAVKGIETEDCRFGPCSLCGVCMDYGVQNILQKGGQN
jgi:radical SAM family uncharacterized protein